MRTFGRAATTVTLVVTLIQSTVVPARAYSVISHEAVIDTVWVSHLKPMLQARFPLATEDQLREAHAYAYGGSLAADMGYAPMSSHFFSDLMHYVRSGDVVENLLRQSQTLKEYAFALGALAHYVADRTAHPFINHITPLTYPKLAAKFGSVMTFEDNQGAHLKTEFGWDVLQLARGNYPPNSYRYFIGFEIDQAGLDRAFQQTYGLKLDDVVHPEISIGMYRVFVEAIVPEMAKVAWDSKRKDIEKLAPETANVVPLHDPSAEYQLEPGFDYKKPGLRQRIFALILKTMPPVGPFKALHFKVVPESGDQLFQQAFDATIAEYCRQLDAVRDGKLHLTNDNLDTGEPVHPGAYALTDQTYSKLLKKLDKKHFDDVPQQTRADIQNYFSKSTAHLDKEAMARLSAIQ